MGVDAIILARRDGAMLDGDIHRLADSFRLAMRVRPASDPDAWMDCWTVGRATDADIADGMPEIDDRSTTIEVGTPERCWAPDYRRGDFVRIAATCEFFRLRGWDVYLGDDASMIVRPWNEVRESYWSAWANAPEKESS